MFGKIFGQIFDSSIADNPDLRHFFMDMIVLSDINGVVNMTPQAISARTRIPLDQVSKMLAELEGPDPESQTPDEDGRRIVRLDKHRSWGWEIVNYTKYRQIASGEQQRESTKIRTRKWRQIKKMQIGDGSVTHGDGCDAMQKQKQKQKQGEGNPPLSNCIWISPVERISLEKERKELKERIGKFNGEYVSQEERLERKGLRERVKQIDAALYIPLPPVKPSVTSK